ncbi:hypothetical protein NDU88_003820 [Pleurodeles waltl]|uniref:Uncharacterized protein n=1 Tax=Pleurodeles waltl TaxID=8319 RepID=A0AAV7LGB0_PLEWA|nr:hypothetical protein NDU88_003820 [Pleurodeles waltl]
MAPSIGHLRLRLRARDPSTGGLTTSQADPQSPLSLALTWDDQDSCGPVRRPVHRTTICVINPKHPGGAQALQNTTYILKYDFQIWSGKVLLNWQTVSFFLLPNPYVNFLLPAWGSIKSH